MIFTGFVLNDFKSLLEDFCKIGGFVSYNGYTLTAGSRDRSNYYRRKEQEKIEYYTILNTKYGKRYEDIDKIILVLYRDNAIDEITIRIEEWILLHV
jgi:hypothetical protein